MDKEETCLNCGAPLQGQYCSQCSQKHINPNLTVYQLLHEFFAELFTFDNRFFRTLKPLIFSPGKVTIDYNSGKRARYMPLLKLYLFVSFTLFLVLALSNIRVVRFRLGDNHSINQQESSQTPQEQEARKKDTEENIKKISPVIKESIAWLLKKKEERGKDSNVLEQDVINRLPHLMFFMMPVFALFLKLFYWRSDSLYTHYLVFSIHIHTFAFIVFLVIILARMTQVGILIHGSTPLAFTPPLYLILGLKKIFRQSWRLTLVKTAAIGFLYFLSFVISFILLAVLTVAVF
jgi:hypothetical protein